MVHPKMKYLLFTWMDKNIVICVAKMNENYRFGMTSGRVNDFWVNYPFMIYFRNFNPYVVDQ